MTAFQELTEATTRATQALDIKPHELAQMLGTQPDDIYVENDQTIRRMGYIIRIHEALSTTYPLDAAYRKHWMHKKCTKLRGQKPIVVMVTEGDSGLIRVLSYLDCTFSWDLTGSKA